MINRATNDGKWKVSSERIKVRASQRIKVRAIDSKEIGIKTHLYFKQNSYSNKTPWGWGLDEYELIDVDPSQNKYFLGKLMMKQSKPTNISSSKGETSQQLPSNYSGNDHIPTPEVQLDFHQEPLVEMEVSNDYDWIQNQTSISDRTNEFINSFPVVNYENFVNDGNEVISNLQPSNLVADYAIPQNLQVDYMELIKNQEAPNIVAENEGFNLPSNFFNYPIADISQMNLSDFDDLYWADGLYLHELFGALNNYDGVQNQLVINQQVAYELRNSNLIDNEIVQPDERNKSAAADEIEGSNNLPSLDMTESSYTMESVRKRSGMELEGSSIGIETEVAQPQAKKSRI